MRLIRDGVKLEPRPLGRLRVCLACVLESEAPLGIYLVCLDMGAECCPPLLRIIVHPRTVLGEDGTVDDHRGCPQCMERLASECGDECALLGEADEMVRGLCLGWEVLEGAVVDRHLCGKLYRSRLESPS